MACCKSSSFVWMVMLSEAHKLSKGIYINRHGHILISEGKNRQFYNAPYLAYGI